MVLRVPGDGPRPAFPAFTADFSRWRVIASHTSRFTGSPPERVTNTSPRRTASTTSSTTGGTRTSAPATASASTGLLGDITADKGYVWGHATGVVNGRVVDIPGFGGGICQLPSTIFPAVMKAGLDVTVRREHSYYPYFYWGYPEGFGWDATIFPPVTDLEWWRNLYDLPVRLFARADLVRSTLTIEVHAPPELIPYPTEIDGPYLRSGNELIPTADAGWVWWPAATVITQRTMLDGVSVDRAFWSFYLRDPYR